MKPIGILVKIGGHVIGFMITGHHNKPVDSYPASESKLAGSPLAEYGIET